MQQDVNVLRPQRAQQIVRAHSLTPVTTRAALKAIRQPQRLVIVRRLAGAAAAVITVLVVEPTTGWGTLGDSLGVDVRVDLDVGGVALEQGRVFSRPSDDLDRDVGVGEVVVARGPLEPLGVLGGEGRVDLVALVLCYGGGGVPADAVVDGSGLREFNVSTSMVSWSKRRRVWAILPLSRHDLIPSIVREAHRITRVIRLEGVIPDLLQRRGQS